MKRGQPCTWTSLDDLRLETLAEVGQSAGAIARKLGRSRTGVKYRAVQLGVVFAAPKCGPSPEQTARSWADPVVRRKRTEAIRIAFYWKGREARI